MKIVSEVKKYPPPPLPPSKIFCSHLKKIRNYPYINFCVYYSFPLIFFFNSDTAINKLKQVYVLSRSMKVCNLNITLFLNIILMRERANHIWMELHFMGNLPKSGPRFHGNVPKRGPQFHGQCAEKWSSISWAMCQKVVVYFLGNVPKSAPQYSPTG